MIRKRIKVFYIKTFYFSIIKAKSKQEYPDPIAESFKHYLEIEDPDVKLPMEDGDLYLEKVRTERPKIGKMYLSKSLDHNTIKKTKLYQGKTVYQVDYCDVEGDMVRKLKAIEDRKTRLPEDWVIPITTQRYDYRKPSGISSLAYERSPQERPPNNLDPNGKGLFRGSTKQEFKDPIAETFKRYLDIENQDIKPPNEDADIYLEKVDYCNIGRYEKKDIGN
ncbi:hypothetical protein NQ317_011812 [Molorchus minor]|uniref:Uncharacterized protein n=1 Tax=Molorchus minor TaxID=1323400 RepID=A0ABQ9JEC9_9CUCU|nr:hypothetical protein NQ317_011812 [Molorchus minor]